jgi:hypothetical protein
MMILIEFGELLNGKYFLCHFWRNYLFMINISVTILSSRKDSFKENIFLLQILVNWEGYRIIWLYGVFWIVRNGIY